MRALDRKFLRDLRRIWAQSLAIAMVLACGVMLLILAAGAERSLSDTRDAWYERNRFAHVFAALTRAPRSLLDDIAAIEGVTAVEGRIGFHVVLDLAGMEEPATARVLSLPADGAPVLNVPLVRTGRLPDPLATDEVALAEPFALAHGLWPGARFSAILNGRLQELRVTGHVLSPEFVYTIGPGAIMPDDRRYGLIWMAEAAAAAAKGLDGAFNEVSVTLVRGASEPAVIAALDRLLAPYGGTGAHGRDRQMSHAFLDSELTQLAGIARIVPPVFFVISAFLVNMVLGRLIAQERQQIGLLKAVGYSTPRIAAQYLRLAAAIGSVGVLIGWGVGLWLGRELAVLYAGFFRFPWLVYAPGPQPYVVSGLLGVATAVAGALRSVMASVRLAPAVAMSPPVPPAYSRGVVDAIGRLLRLRQTTMMILRSITRWPGRAAITLFGVAASVAMLVSSYFSFDASQSMVDEVFDLANRQHVTLALAGGIQPEAVAEARRLPGVLMAEGGYGVPVRVSLGNRSRLIGLSSGSDAAELARLVAAGGQVVRAPAGGIALPERLADQLGVAPGERVQVELLAPPRETWDVPVTALLRQSLGQEVVMPAAELFARMRIAPQVNRIDLLIDPSELPALYAEVKRTPAIAGVTLWPEARRAFDDTIAENLGVMRTIYTLIGVLMTLGVVYNAARIQVSERAHELATLRVLGFSRAEVGFVLVGEVMLLTIVGVPVGWVLGYAFAAATAAGLSTDLFDIPVVVTRATYAMAAAVVVVTALVSVLLVRRRLDRVELASALKQRE